MVYNYYFLGLVITNNPVDVTVCSGNKANMSCGFTGVYSSNTTKPNWRITRSGDVNSNETVNWMNISNNNDDGLEWKIITKGDKNNASGSFLSVGPVNETYNNTSYQCIFTINDTIIESTVGTITIIGMYTYIRNYIIRTYHINIHN